MLLARPGIKPVVSAGIEREPKRTVPNDLGRTLTVALPLFSSFMGFFFDKLKSGPVDLNEHQNNVKQALRQVNLTPIILVLFTKRLLSPHWQWISRLFSVLRSLRNQAVGGKPFTAISKRSIVQNEFGNTFAPCYCRNIHGFTRQPKKMDVFALTKTRCMEGLVTS